jgi:hypothetical protein
MVHKHKHRLAQRQARQVKGKKGKQIRDSGYEFTQGRGTGPFVREDQRLSEAF